ncbi:MAG: hypothetical protein ACUZ8H_10705 [Candidatus Anammoxibacter sp.]
MKKMFFIAIISVSVLLVQSQASAQNFPPGANGCTINNQSVNVGGSVDITGNALCDFDSLDCASETIALRTNSEFGNISRTVTCGFDGCGPSITVFGLAGGTQNMFGNLSCVPADGSPIVTMNDIPFEITVVGAATVGAVAVGEAIVEFEDGVVGTNPGIGCNGSRSLGLPQTNTMKKLMGKLRDRIETNWTAEHDYIELYNDNIKELTQIVNSDTELASKLYSERIRLMPNILLLIFGAPVELSTTDIEMIEGVLDTIYTDASSQLKYAIDQVRPDLRNKEVLSSYGISVK